MPKARGGFYAVNKGREPGVYLTWDECEAQVKGFHGARYQKFMNAAEAEAFAGHPIVDSPMDVHQSPEKVVPKTTGATSRTSPYRKAGSSTALKASPTVPKAAPTVPKAAPPLPTAAHIPVKKPERVNSNKTNAISSTIKWYQRDASPDIQDESDWNVAYCDGACRGNGKPGSIAGIGVWWQTGDPRNISERCPGDQTNNRAELIAIARLLETTLQEASTEKKFKLIIKTDSRYSMDCFKKWLPNWENNGFRGSTGKPIKNVPVIRYVSALLNAHASQGHVVRLQHVQGHAGIPGNEGADALAGQGATLPTVEEQDWDNMAKNLKIEISTTPPKSGGGIEISDGDLEMYAECLVDDDELMHDLDFYADGLADDDEIAREINA